MPTVTDENTFIREGEILYWSRIPRTGAMVRPGPIACIFVFLRGVSDPEAQASCDQNFQYLLPPPGHRYSLLWRFLVGALLPRAGQVFFASSEFIPAQIAFSRTGFIFFIFDRDNRSSFDRPLLTGAYYADPVGMTIESCIAFCDSQPVSYRFVGVTDGFQCCALFPSGDTGLSRNVRVFLFPPQHATISSSTSSRAWAKTSAMRRAAVIRRRWAVVGART
jgi:hypothetical protein